MSSMSNPGRAVSFHRATSNSVETHSGQHLIVLTGAMAAGKSTVAQALAERLPRSVHLRGDIFRRMIVQGAAPMGPQLTEEAHRQLVLRHMIATDAARAYHDAGFSVVYQDILLGAELARVLGRMADLRPKVFALLPDVATLAHREAGRAKTGYSPDFPPAILADAFEVDLPDGVMRIDNSRMTVAEVVELILSR